MSTVLYRLLIMIVFIITIAISYIISLLSLKAAWILTLIGLACAIISGFLTKF